jgi:hypothetical protein
MGAGIVGTLMLVYAGFTALAVAAAVSIVRKAGYSGWWVLLGLVPLVNLVMVFAFAFADWPVLRDLRRATSVAGSARTHPSFAPAPQGHPAFAPFPQTWTDTGRNVTGPS